MKKKLFLFLTVLLVFTGCGNNNGENGGKGLNRDLTVNDLSIKDFVIDTKAGKCDEEDCYIVTFKNNSNFDIVDVGIRYKVKDSATEEELAVYQDFVDDYSYSIYDDEPLYNVTLIGRREVLVEAHKEVSNIELNIGYDNYSWYDYPTEEQYNLMELKELKLGILSNYKMFIASYDYTRKEWKIDTDTVVADVWTKNEIGKKIEKPEGKHFIVDDDDLDEFEIFVYGVTNDMFTNYVEKVKKAGFIDDEPSRRRYEGVDSEGYEVRVRYYEDDETMAVRIRKGDE